MTRNSLIGLALLAAFGSGMAVATLAPARADANSGIDTRLVERLVRAEEQQERRLEQLVRATEKCHDRH